MLVTAPEGILTRPQIDGSVEFSLVDASLMSDYDPVQTEVTRVHLKRVVAGDVQPQLSNL